MKNSKWSLKNWFNYRAESQVESKDKAYGLCDWIVFQFYELCERSIDHIQGTGIGKHWGLTTGSL